MNPPPMKPSRNAKVVVTALLAVVLVCSGVAVGARADDIPHENYDLVGSNLDFVISLLNASIGYSEGALMAMYNQTMSDVSSNLTVVSGVLTPAARLLDEIKDVADSYGNLSYLIPPFADLSDQMTSFSSMESAFIADRSVIVTASHLQNLSGPELVAALDAISAINSLIRSMNSTIDEMLVSANGIIALAIEDRTPFAHNQLIPLIEKLRDLLFLMELQIEEIIHNDIHWSNTEPFLLLWLSASQYYLGETIIGGGYVYFDGVFAVGHPVRITLDGENLTSINTVTGGKFLFSYLIPVNASWLGTHSVQALSDTPNGTLSSSAIAIRIVLIPTKLKLTVTNTLLSPPETLTANAVLTDIDGNRLPNAPCHMFLDNQNISFTTNSTGEFERAWLGFDLDYGTHSMQAFYEGVLPYAPSSSSNLSIEVNIPTDIEVTLLSDRAYIGYFLVVSGRLESNGSTPMAGFEVTLLIDDVPIENLTTGANGEFEMSVPTDEMNLGAHTLTAAFIHREYIWRYSQDSVSFTVYSSKQAKYPFFPTIPGWGGLSPPGSITYLFIGANAYYFWLLVLLLVGISIRVVQTRNSRKMAQEKARADMLVSLEKAPEPSSGPAPTAAEFSEELAGENRGPATPNDRIIWYYQRLLTFLTQRDSLSLRSSMTHWEVARLLKTVGYPTKPVDKATILFEKALYSGDLLSDTDTIQMSSTLTSLIGSKKAVS